MEQVLVYTQDAEKAQKIEALCASLGVGFRRLTLKDLRFSVASVISGDYKLPLGAVPPLSALYVQPELMLFSGLKDRTLNAFLKRYKQEKITPIPLKAVVTPFNCSWTLVELTAQLQREHASFSK